MLMKKVKVYNTLTKKKRQLDGSYICQKGLLVRVSLIHLVKCLGCGIRIIFTVTSCICRWLGKKGHCQGKNACMYLTVTNHCNSKQALNCHHFCGYWQLFHKQFAKRLGMVVFLILKSVIKGMLLQLNIRCSPVLFPSPYCSGAFLTSFLIWIVTHVFPTCFVGHVPTSLLPVSAADFQTLKSLK